MRGDPKAWVNAYCDPSRQHRKKVSADDGRVAADHKRFFRSFVDVPVGKTTVIRYFPLKYAAKPCGVTIPTLYAWQRSDLIRFRKVYGMEVLCLAECSAIHNTITLFYGRTANGFNITEAFKRELNAALLAVRTAIDCVAKGIPLTDSQRTLLLPNTEA